MLMTERSDASKQSFGIILNIVLHISEHDLFRFVEMVFRNDSVNVPCHSPGSDWDSFIRLSILSNRIRSDHEGFSGSVYLKTKSIKVTVVNWPRPSEAVEEDKVTESVGMS